MHLLGGFMRHGYQMWRRAHPVEVGVNVPSVLADVVGALGQPTYDTGGTR